MQPQNITNSTDGEDTVDTRHTTSTLAQEKWKRPVPPINRLPVEVLSMIFEWLSCMDGMYVSSFGSRSAHSIEIMRVCKPWTNIAMNTVSLWQKIEVRTRGNWLAIALPRSKESPTHVYHVLEHLHFPPSADIHLDLAVFLDGDGSELPEASENMDSYLKLIPPDTSCLPILHTMTSARLYSPGRQNHRGEWVDDSFSGKDDQGSLKLTYEIDQCPYFMENSPRPPWPITRATQLSDFCALFARAPLTSLTIDLHALLFAPLLQAFRTFPHLSTLELFAGPDDVEAVCIAGLFTALVSPADAGSLPDAPGARVVLPALRTLRLEGVPQSARVSVLCTLFACLALRAQRGTVLLSSLCVEGFTGTSGGSVEYSESAIISTHA
ncbi:hypothetical protein VTO73DRAFT_11770 [Trametes versicolor]